MKENKVFLTILLLAAVGILIAHFGFHKQLMGGMQNMSGSGAMQNTEKIAPNTVQIKGYAFMPASMKIKKGTTITWENFDLAPHTVTVDDANQNGPKSKLISKGQKFSYTFSEVGKYPYHCEPHPYMKAVIEVTE
jgi:plastocyanin